jgi:hypothetical protein
MATGTLGTAATSSLVSINGWNPATAIADVAAIAQHILGQTNPTHPIVPGAFSPSGLLYLPGHRGVIKVQPGDYVAYDHFGWPIVVSSQSIADGSSSWAHS